MINLIVIAISAIMLALLLVWWRWEAFRVWIEAPKYSMLRQERWFDTGLGKTLNHHGVEDIDAVHSSSLRGNWLLRRTSDDRKSTRYSR